MGYASYIVFSGPHTGEPCGYAEDSTCDEPGCAAEIDRGLAYLCGRTPGGDDVGCGGYFCGDHLFYAAPDGSAICRSCAETNDEERD